MKIPGFKPDSSILIQKQISTFSTKITRIPIFHTINLYIYIYIYILYVLYYYIIYICNEKSLLFFGLMVPWSAPSSPLPALTVTYPERSPRHAESSAHDPQAALSSDPWRQRAAPLTLV